MNDSSQREVERPAVGPGEWGRALGIAVTATAEYRAFTEAQRRYLEDTQARELFGQIQEAQRTVQVMRQLQGDPSQEIERLEELQRASDANQTITAYFQTEQKLIALLRELNEFISGSLDLDFAALTKPKTGCCG